MSATWSRFFRICLDIVWGIEFVTVTDLTKSWSKFWTVWMASGERTPWVAQIRTPMAPSRFSACKRFRTKIKTVFYFERVFQCLLVTSTAALMPLPVSMTSSTRTHILPRTSPDTRVSRNWNKDDIFKLQENSYTIRNCCSPPGVLHFPRSPLQKLWLTGAPEACRHPRKWSFWTSSASQTCDCSFA